MRALATNFLHPDVGTLVDVAFDKVGNNLFVATNSSILRIDAATGQTLATFSMPGGNSGRVGLQVLPVDMMLANVPIPAGSLLVTNGGADRDKIYALNATTGVIRATLDLGQNFDPVAGLYDPVSGSLFILDDSPDQVMQLNPSNGAVQNTFTVSFDISAGGLALDPTSGNLWIGSSESTSIVEVIPTGANAGMQVRTVDLASQSISNEIRGLAFNTAGQLLVSSLRDVVYQLNVPPVTQGALTLTAITATAKDGTPTNAAAASANVAQTIELVGTNFTLSSQVRFPDTE